MTPREQAAEVYGKLYIDEHGDVTTKERDIAVIAASLADARRAVWEEAAQMAEDLSADCLFKPDLDTSRIVERFAVTLRAHAQAKEGA